MLKYFDKVDFFCKDKILHRNSEILNCDYYETFPINNKSESKDTAKHWCIAYNNTKSPIVYTFDNDFEGA